MPPPKDWNKVGEDDEGMITIDEYMTYDEIAISSLIGVAVPTLFINSGGRNNMGYPEDDHEEWGIYVALTGARFEKRDKMESLHMLVSDYSTADNGYGEKATDSPRLKLLKIWAQFYNMKLPNNDFGFPSYTEVEEAYNTNKDSGWASEFFQWKSNPYAPTVYINKSLYKKRIAIILDPFLYEANDRALQCKKKAYVHAIGLGLGVWQICPQQAEWMVQVYHELLRERSFEHIAVIDFSWFPSEVQQQSQPIITKAGNSIEIRFSKRDPAEKLDNSDYLLVAMYAWDGNSYPGNEYWRGMLHASGDPAAACCSTITELQNPEINEEFVKNIKWWPEHHSEEKKQEKPPIKANI
jgi:hypothetical protein